LSGINLVIPVALMCFMHGLQQDTSGMISFTRTRIAHTPTLRAFTLVEVLVVISIIAVLAAILLVALGSATDTARRARTTATLNSFRAACDSFALDHNVYPGVIPTTALGTGDRLTSTQNALIHLMGGYRAYNENSPASDQALYGEYKTQSESEGRDTLEMTFTDEATGLDWNLLVVPSRMGEGPFIGNKPYSPYFAPKKTELIFNELGAMDPTQGLNLLPNLVDAWGQPVLYFKRERTMGPIFASDTQPGMFYPYGQTLYLSAERLGELGHSQTQTPGPGSRLAFSASDSTDTNEEQHKWLTLMLSHPSFYDVNAPDYGTPKAAYMLLSAGVDGVYMARNDGPVDSTGAFEYGHADATHEDLQKFDDVTLYGGG